MLSRVDAVKQDVIRFILKNRNRQQVADSAGLHVNTVSQIVSGRVESFSINTLIKLELAVNELKEKRAKEMAEITERLKNVRFKQ
tara:strand:+ start:112 stop:366 length:255 start_codon:yes stop_codon:yes gene_type:complete